MTKSQCRKAFEEWLKINGVNDVSQNQEWLKDALYTAWEAATKNAIHWAAFQVQEMANDYVDDGCACEGAALCLVSDNLCLRINDLDIEEGK